MQLASNTDVYIFRFYIVRSGDYFSTIILQVPNSLMIG